MTKPEKHCLGLQCPERFSLCCGAGSHPMVSLLSSDETLTNVNTPVFVCDNCNKEFQGGECTAGFSGNQPYTLQQLQDLLPEYVDEEYPKGETKDRGKATVMIVLYIQWLRKQELKDENS